MSVAFDARSGGTGTGTISFTHTPVGTPKGVYVYVMQVVGADQVTAVTYGGEAMTEVTGSPNAKATGEAMAVACFFLGEGIPTGAQTVEVTVSGAALKAAECHTLTAADDTEIVDVDATINSDATTNPSVTMATSGRECYGVIGFFSGHDDVNPSMSPATGWTLRLETDAGSQSAGVYTMDVNSSTDFAAGWTQTEDAVAIALAISEVESVGGDINSRLIGGSLINRGITFGRLV